MACSRILASTVGLLVLISLTNGQTDVNKPIPGCDSRDMAAGIYTFPDPNYCQNFILCSNNVQTKKVCAEGTIYDSRISQCNHVSLAVNSAAPCSQATVGRSYPGVCCEKYYRCNGESLVAMTCPNGQYFNAQTGQCGQFPCVDQNETCSRPKAPSGIQWNCELIPDPSNPCNYQHRNISGRPGPSQQCAEGTRFDVGACTCIADPSCMRRANVSGSKTPDPMCRADVKVTFESFQPGTNNPQVYSDKTGTPTPDYVQAYNVRYGTGEAIFNSNSQTGALASLYFPVFSNKEVANNFIAEFVLRATVAGPFEIFSNNLDGACVATISINGTYNGNGGYQVSGFVTGATATSLNQQITNTAQLTATINVGGTDFILVRIVYSGRVSMQLGNRGPTGTGTGQIVNAQESGVIGEKLAYNKCGFQICRGLTGSMRSVTFREACLNPDLYRT